MDHPFQYFDTLFTSYFKQDIFYPKMGGNHRTIKLAYAKAQLSWVEGTHYLIYCVKQINCL